MLANVTNVSLSIRMSVKQDYPMNVVFCRHPANLVQGVLLHSSVPSSLHMMPFSIRHSFGDSEPEFEDDIDKREAAYSWCFLAPEQLISLSRHVILRTRHRHRRWKLISLVSCLAYILHVSPLQKQNTKDTCQVHVSVWYAMSTECCLILSCWMCQSMLSLQRCF